jgi:hypothetical protein
MWYCCFFVAFFICVLVPTFDAVSKRRFLGTKKKGGLSSSIFLMTSSFGRRAGGKAFLVGPLARLQYNSTGSTKLFVRRFQLVVHEKVPPPVVCSGSICLVDFTLF